MMNSFAFKTQPFKHQLAEWELSRDMEARGIFWEMGCGKSWLALNSIAWKASKGELNGALLLAPNGVHANWYRNEIPSHYPSDDWCAFVYHSKEIVKRSVQRELDAFLEDRRFEFLCMTYDALVTEKGKALAKLFLTSGKRALVCDESSRLKNPTAKRTRTALAASKHSPYVRILSGTPIANSPFDAFSQVKILDEDYWKKMGIDNFTVFKHTFGVWKEAQKGNGQRFPVCVALRDLDRLNKMLQPISSRVLKEDVLDLPPKLYQTRYFDLTPQQWKAYEELANQCETTLASGESVTALLAITQLLRFQQITCGYLPLGEDRYEQLGSENPRLKLLLDTLEDVEGSAIIWARFRHDIDQIMKALGPDAVRYDGSTEQKDREKAIQRFQAGEVRFFVANPAAAGEGLTLTRAKTAIYFSNSFNLVHRLQSEDRCHRIGTDSAVTYIDLCAEGTIDEHVIDALRKKLEISSIVTGDRLKDWI